MGATDARPIVRKNVAYRVYFPIFDNTGSLVSGAANLDSERSLDGGAFSDCTNEATEIGASGVYYLDLLAAETNADAVCIIVKTTTIDAKTTPIVLYPEELGDMRITCTGDGSVPTTVNALSGGLPVDGACVKVYTDIALANLIAVDYSDAFGHANFNLDPGTYYVVITLSGYTFPDYTTVVVT